jgi:hypothetical protein
VASPRELRARHCVQLNPTLHNTSIIDNMADDEKEKAEKVAAAKKRVCTRIYLLVLGQECLEHNTAAITLPVPSYL